MSLLLVINPISGGVDKNTFLQKVKSYCAKYSIDLNIFNTTGEDDVNKLSEAIRRIQPSKVAAGGGDGTILLCSVVLRNSNIPLGIIPLGSANGMAAELFVNLDPMEAFKDIVVSQVIHGLDMIVVNKEHYCIHIGDVGINASIVEAYDKDENRGMATYAKYFLEEVNDPKSIDFKLEYDGKTIESSALMIAICNARKYGTGIPLNTIGNPMDGKFEIVIIEKINLNKLIKAGLSSIDEKFAESNDGIIISCKEAKVIFNNEQLLQLDGEVIGKFKELNVEIIPSAVRLITHNNNPLIR